MTRSQIPKHARQRWRAFCISVVAERYTGLVFFRWDPKKAASNRKKHGIDFHEAATVFLDDLSSAFPDPEHSETEDRFVTIGTSSKGRILIVVHVDGAQSIRIISARKATAHERRYYEEGGN